MKYQELIDMGFTRHDFNDNVSFHNTGYHGFALEMGFDNLNVGISTGCFITNEASEWKFKLYRIDSGSIVRQIKAIELKPLIEHLQQKSEEMERVISDVDKTVKVVNKDF